MKRKKQALLISCGKFVEIISFWGKKISDSILKIDLK
jgi:hypothetical protein